MTNSVTSKERDDRIDRVEETLLLQARKINALLVENEKLGSQNHELQQKITLLEHENSRLLPWYKLATSKLRTEDIQLADQQFDILWGYVHAMGSPGHRVVTFFSRQVSKLWLGRVCKRSLKWIYAIVKA